MLLFTDGTWDLYTDDASNIIFKENSLWSNKINLEIRSTNIIEIKNQNTTCLNTYK